jgi:hypothetical protein
MYITTGGVSMIAVMHHEFQKLSHLFPIILVLMILSFFVKFSIYTDYVDFQRALCSLFTCWGACFQFSGSDGFFHKRSRTLPVSTAQRLFGIIAASFVLILTICSFNFLCDTVNDGNFSRMGSFHLLTLLYVLPFPLACAFCLKASMRIRVGFGILVLLWSFSLALIFNGGDALKAGLPYKGFHLWYFVNYFVQEQFIALFFLCTCAYCFGALWCIHFRKRLESLLLSTITLLLCLILLFAFQDSWFDLKLYWIYAGITLIFAGILVPLLFKDSGLKRQHLWIGGCLVGAIVSWSVLFLTCWIATNLQCFPGRITWFEKDLIRNEYSALREHLLYSQFFHPFQNTRYSTVEHLQISEDIVKIQEAQHTYHLSSHNDLFRRWVKITVSKGDEELPQHLKFSLVEGTYSDIKNGRRIFVHSPKWKGHLAGIDPSNGELYFELSQPTGHYKSQPYLVWNPTSNAWRPAQTLSIPDWLSQQAIKDQHQTCSLKVQSSPLDSLHRICQKTDGTEEETIFLDFLKSRESEQSYPDSRRKSPKELFFFNRIPLISSTNQPVPTKELRLVSFSVTPTSSPTGLPFTLRVMQDTNVYKTRIQVDGKYENNSFSQGWIISGEKPRSLLQPSLVDLQISSGNLVLILNISSRTNPFYLCFQIPPEGDDLRLFHWDGIYQAGSVWSPWTTTWERWNTDTKRLHLEFVDDQIWSWEMKLIPLESLKAYREEV